MNQKTPNLLAKKFYFALLYFTEGAPIGLLWIALPTLFRNQDITVKMITQYSSLLVLPWSLKFVWAPIVDTCRGPKFTYRSWMILAQIMMGLTLIPLLFLNLKTDFRLISKILLLHAFFSSIQDIAIDSLAISVTAPQDRGRINGWMQMGQFLGQSAFGGGTILMTQYLGFPTVVSILIASIWILGFITSRSEIMKPKLAPTSSINLKEILTNFKNAFAHKNMLWGLLLALTILSAEKAFTGLLGPYLLDRGFAEMTIGTFLAFPSIILTILGSLFGGYFADQLGKKRVLAYATIVFAIIVTLIVTVIPNQMVIGMLCLLYFLAGILITTSYSLLMNLTTPSVAATQFSALMGMINLCESYSVFLVGKIVNVANYQSAFIATCFISLVSLIFVKVVKEPDNESVTEIMGASGTGPIRN